MRDSGNCILMWTESKCDCIDWHSPWCNVELLLKHEYDRAGEFVHLQFSPLLMKSPAKRIYWNVDSRLYFCSTLRTDFSIYMENRLPSCHETCY